MVATLTVWWGAGCTPSGPRALLQGEQLIRKGNHESAVAKLELAVNLMPNEARAWNYLGVARHGAGAYGDAIIAYQRAQALDRNLAAARYNLGELYLEQGNPLSASEELMVFTALEPKSVNGWLRLGDALLAVPQLEKALNAYYAALNLDREMPAAYNGVGLIQLQRKNPQQAHRFFVEALKYDPDYTPAILNLAVMAHQTPDALPSALNRYKEYLAKAPDAANAAGVRTAIRQIELKLNPPPVVVEAVEPKTNVAPPIAESPRTATTNVSATVQLATATNRNTSPKVPVVDRDPPSVPAGTPTNSGAVVAVKTNSPTAPPKSPPPKLVGVATNKTPATVAKNNPPEVRRPVESRDQPAIQKTEPQPAISEQVESSTQPPKPAITTTAPRRNEAVSPPETERAATEEPPLEVVNIAESEVPAAETGAQPTPIQPVASSNPVPPPSTNAIVSKVESTGGEERDRGFFQRINPVNLFRRDRSEPEPIRTSDIITPLPGDPEPTLRPADRTTADSEPAATPVREVAAVTPEPRVTPLPTTAVMAPRYEYGRIPKPKPGDRGAAERLFERGIGAQTRQDSAGASTFFAAAAEADPTYFPAQYNLGLAAYKSGQWFKAMSAFETALALDSSSVEARYNFALTLQKSNFAADAAVELEKLVAARPDHTPSHLLLGNVYAQSLDNVDGARKHYARVLELDPRHPQATAIRYWLSEHP